MASTDRPVVVQIPADTSLLRVARVALASLAAELPFTLQDIEDLRVAVDEMAAAVIDGCPEGSTLVITMRLGQDQVEVEGCVADADPLTPLHPVAADLLGLVAAGYELDQDGEDRTFRFAKRPQVHAS